MVDRWSKLHLDLTVDRQFHSSENRGTIITDVAKPGVHKQKLVRSLRDQADRGIQAKSLP